MNWSFQYIYIYLFTYLHYIYILNKYIVHSFSHPGLCSSHRSLTSWDDRDRHWDPPGRPACRHPPCGNSGYRVFRIIRSTGCLYQNLTLYPLINVFVCLKNDCIVPGQWYRPPPAWTLAASLSCPHTPAPGQYRVFRNVSYKYRVFILAWERPAPPPGCQCCRI